MPSISFTINGKSLSFELEKKVTKEDLYGTLKRLVVKGGEVLERGYLTADGHPMPTSAISTERLDPEGTPIEKEEVLYDGEVREILPGSFDEAAPLEPAPILTLVTFCVTDVYPLTSEGGLVKGLYHTWFSYRKSPERKDAYLLVKETGVFLLVLPRRFLLSVIQMSMPLSILQTGKFFTSKTRRNSQSLTTSNTYSMCAALPANSTAMFKKSIMCSEKNANKPPFTVGRRFKNLQVNEKKYYTSPFSYSENYCRIAVRHS